jgi:hypothetical protein
MSRTAFLEIKAKWTGSSGPSAELTELAVVSNSDLGDRPAVDVKLLAGLPRAIVVNEYGAVYKCTFSQAGTRLYVYFRGSTFHLPTSGAVVNVHQHRPRHWTTTFGGFL